MNRSKLRERTRAQIQELREAAERAVDIADYMEKAIARISNQPISTTRGLIDNEADAAEALAKRILEISSHIHRICGEMTPNTDMLTNSTWNPGNYD